MPQTAQPGDEFRAGGNHAGLVQGPHDLGNGRTGASDVDFPGGRAAPLDRQDVTQRLREKHSVPQVSFADHLIELTSVTPGRLVQIVRGEKYGAGVERIGISHGAQSLNRSGRAAFHVRGTAAGDLAILDSGRNERQVHDVEMAVELESSAGSVALEANGNSRTVRISSGWPLHLKPVGRQDLV